MRTLASSIAVCSVALAMTGCTTIPPALPPSINVTAELYDVDLSGVPLSLNSTELTTDFLAQLVAKSKATRTKVVGVLTQPEQQCTLKVVTEYIYPTEFESEGIGSQNNNNNKQKGSVGAVVTPSSFETREVGTILEILARILPDGRIELTMSPEFVAPPIWKSYGQAKDLKDEQSVETVMEQPFFHTFSFRSAILLKPGQPVIVARCPSLESDEKVTVMVIKATTICN